MNIRHGILSTIFYMDELPTNLCKLLWHTLFALILYTLFLAVTIATWLTLAAGVIATGMFVHTHPLATITIIELAVVLIVLAIAVIGLTLEYIKERIQDRRYRNWRDGRDEHGVYVTPAPHTATVLYRAFKDKFCPTITWSRDHE